MVLKEDRHKQVINYALNILQDKQYEKYIEKIYLFGSCAKNIEKYSSDVDLLIECNEKMTPEIARKMRIAVMPDELDMPEVDLKFVIKNDWKKQKTQFSKNLVKEGILLWKKK